MWLRLKEDFRNEGWSVLIFAYFASAACLGILFGLGCCMNRIFNGRWYG